MTTRGQTLVLFALTLLLTVLMVLMTLGINRRVHQRLTLQTMADTSAYSEAVATARAYNAVSLMNRAIVSHMVSLTGVTSLASWASVYYSTLATAAQSAQGRSGQLAAQALFACRNGLPQCACLGAQAGAINSRLLPAIRGELARLDELYAQGHICEGPAMQARALQMKASGDIRDEQRAVLRELEQTVLGRQVFASRTAALAGGDRLGLSAPPAQAAVSLREVRDGTNCLVGLDCDVQRNDIGPLVMVLAAQGSRGDGFLTGRGGGTAPIIEQWRARVLARAGLGVFDIVGGDSGSGYWDGRENHARSVTTLGGADDHFAGVLVYGPVGACPSGALALTGRAFVTPKARTPPTHFIEGVGDDGEPMTHMMADQGSGFGVWPRSLLYDETRVALEADAFGQPKTLSVLERFIGAQPDPWQLDVRFLGGRFDGHRLDRQAALATGLAYYHRAGHFREPPNLLNPFWRATLVAGDVDAQAAADLPAALGRTAVADASAVYRGLLAAGFQGLQ